MALAPRGSLRSVALLLSNGKPRLSSLFSSAPKATPGNGTLAARGEGDAPVAPAVQPPPAPVQGSDSTCPQERVLHNKHPEDCTPKPLTHKRSPKKHHHRNHKVPEESSSLDKPKHPTPEPNGRARIHGGAAGKPSAHHHRNHKVCEDPDAGVADGSSRSSSLDNPKHPTPEPNGRARIHCGAVGKPSAYAPQKDHKHSVPGASCSTSQPLPDKVPKEHSEDHKGREDHVARGPRMSSRDTPGHGVTEP